MHETYLRRSLFVCLLLAVGCDTGTDDPNDADDTADVATGDADTSDEETDVAADDTDVPEDDATQTDADAPDAEVSDDVEADPLDDTTHDADEDVVHESPHFSYEGETGPAFWGTLSESWATCGEGTEQSPIDLGSAAPGYREGLEFSYVPSPLVVLHNGHTVQVEYAAGSSLIVDGESYALAQFHVHTASEHTFKGDQADLEFHFVHRNERGELAVVGLFAMGGEHDARNEAFDPFFAHLPIEETPAEAIEGLTIDAAAMIPADLAHWHYEGSLTTPPCSEGVSWYLLAATTTVSEQDVDAVRERFETNARPVQPLGERHVQGAHFSYSGETGPEHWADLSPMWSQCAEGEMQSPIDIPAEQTAGDLASLAFEYGTSGLTVLNNGHTVQVNVDEGSTLYIEDEPYRLQQFHFHAHSENTVGGDSYPLEMHLVHANEVGQLAVVGVFLDDLGVEDFDGLAAVWAHLPVEEQHAERIEGVSIEPGALIPEGLSGWAFEGSLTTPPCTSGVAWYLMKTPLSLSPAQVSAFTAIFDHNARPTQPLNGRPFHGEL